MELKIEVNGWCGNLVAGVVPRKLIDKIGEYCNKHNEDVNNIIYDDALLASLGNELGLSELGWRRLPGVFYRNNGHWWKPKPNYLASYVDGKEWAKYSPEELKITPKIIKQPAIADTEVVLITGITSKGSITYTFNNLTEEFNPARLTIYLDKISDFYQDERLSSNLTYVNKDYDTVMEHSQIKYWYDPIVYLNREEADLLTDYIYA